MRTRKSGGSSFRTIYVANEDGDKGGKREYCNKLGIQYLDFETGTCPWLAEAAISTELRGF